MQRMGIRLGATHNPLGFNDDLGSHAMGNDWDDSADTQQRGRSRHRRRRRSRSRRSEAPFEPDPRDQAEPAESPPTKRSRSRRRMSEDQILYRAAQQAQVAIRHRGRHWAFSSVSAQP